MFGETRRTELERFEQERHGGIADDHFTRAAADIDDERCRLLAIDDFVRLAEIHCLTHGQIDQLCLFAGGDDLDAEAKAIKYIQEIGDWLKTRAWTTH